MKTLPVSLLLVTAAQAESPYERDQREQLEQEQRTHGLSPQAQQWANWDREYSQQHWQQAEDYKKAVELSGRMAREEAVRDEAERIRRSGY